MNPLAVAAGVSWTVLFLLDLVLIVAAFRSSLPLGVLTLFIPFYAVTTGNHRLLTSWRRRLAAAWWISFALALTLALASTSR
jgi:hypothetical protein